MGRTVHVCLLLLLLILLFIARHRSVSAFSPTETQESIGGLINEPRVLTDRGRIDAEAATGSASGGMASATTTTKTLTSTHAFNLSCPTENLTFPSDGVPHTLVCNFTGHTTTPVAASFDTDLHAVATLVPAFWIYLSPGEVDMMLNFSIGRHRMGSVYLKVWIREAKQGGGGGTFHSFDRLNVSSVYQYTRWLANGSGTHEEDEAAAPAAMGLHLRILRPRGVAEIIFRVVVVGMICCLTVVMGCELDAMAMWNYFRKPVSPLIGFLCQFGLMPLIAFGVAMLVPVKREFGFGLLTAGCSPGGGKSNVWTLLLHGDLNLSMTMTFVSSVAALGMMPLTLFIYGRFFLDTKAIRIPYSQIAGQLCYLLVPAFLGMLMKWRWPKVAKRCVRLLLKPLTFVFISFVIGFSIYANLPIYALLGAYPLLLPAAAALPWIGFLLAGVVAWLCRRSRAEILTISIETGIKNVGITTLVLIYSMPQPEGDIGAVIPLAMTLFIPIPLMIAYGIVVAREGKCSQCCRKKEGSAIEERNEEQHEPLKSSPNDHLFETAPL